MGSKPALPHVIGNKISTTLASGINSSTLTIPLTSGVGFNTSGGYIIVDKGLSTEEVIYLESVSGSTGTASSDGRGQAGTSAVAHSSGATVYDVLINDHIEGIRTEFLVDHTIAGIHTKVEVPVTVSYKASAYLSGTHNISTGTVTLVNLDTEIFDSNNNFSTVSHQYTAPVTGHYLIAGTTGMAIESGKVMQCHIFVNGTSISRSADSSATATNNLSLSTTTVTALTAGDLVDLRVFHTNVGTTALANSLGQTRLDIHLLSI